MTDAKDYAALDDLLDRAIAYLRLHQANGYADVITQLRAENNDLRIGNQAKDAVIKAADRSIEGCLQTITQLRAQLAAPPAAPVLDGAVTREDK